MDGAADRGVVPLGHRAIVVLAVARDDWLDWFPVSERIEPLEFIVEPTFPLVLAPLLLVLLL